MTTLLALDEPTAPSVNLDAFEEALDNLDATAERWARRGNHWYPHLLPGLRRALGLTYARRLQLTPAQMRLLLATAELYEGRVAS